VNPPGPHHSQRWAGPQGDASASPPQSPENTAAPPRRNYYFTARRALVPLAAPADAAQQAGLTKRQKKMAPAVL